MRVLGTIIKLFATYKPIVFWGWIAAVLAVISIAFFIPILIEFIQTGLVPNFPTLIVCGFTMLAAIHSLFAGVTLQTMVQKNKQDFEMYLNETSREKRRLLAEKK